MGKLFTIEANDNIVEIHLNDEGVEFLMNRLNKLKKNSENEHEHLMTPDWGGNEITNIKQNLDEKIKLMHHLKLVYWKND